MKKKILIANIGNSDLTISKFYLGGKNLNKNNRLEFKKLYPEFFEQREDLRTGEIVDSEKKFKEITEIIFKNFDKYKENLNLEIISKLKEKFSDIIIVSTNQIDARDNFRNSDTIFEGKIIEKIFGEKSKIFLEEVNFNTSDEEKVFEFYESLIRRYNLKNIETTILISAGIPALNNALFLNAVKWIKNLSVCRISDDGKVFYIDYENTVKKYFVQDAILKLIKKYEYSSAISILEDSNAEFTNKETILNVLKFVNSILFFDLESAKILQEKLHSKKEKLKFLSSLEDFEKTEIKIFHLWIGTKIYFKQRRFTDAVARIYNLWDNFVNFYLEKNYKFKWTDERGFLIEKAKEFFTTDVKSKIKEILGSEFDENRQFNSIAKICLFYALNNNKFEKSFFVQLKELMEKRNESFVAHRLEGLTENDFADFCGIENFIKEQEKILQNEKLIKKQWHKILNKDLENLII